MINVKQQWQHFHESFLPWLETFKQTLQARVVQGHKIGLGGGVLAVNVVAASRKNSRWVHWRGPQDLSLI